MKRRLQRLDIELLVIETIEETKEAFADLNRAQWAAGELNDGSLIRPPYSLKYARVRQREGLQTAVVDLKRKGAFYKGYGVLVDNDVVRESSEVEYEGSLTKRYGKGLWGLNPENLATYVTGPFWSVMRPKVIATLFL